jgi:hypothetical protein
MILDIAEEAQTIARLICRFDEAGGVSNQTRGMRGKKGFFARLDSVERGPQLYPASFVAHVMLMVL